MSAGELVAAQAQSLPALIDRAARALTGARSSAEILEARDMASVVYDMAKKAARMAQAKGAHDTLVAAAHRAQADALEIEAQAKRRLADEYEQAVEDGEMSGHGRNWGDLPTLADVNIPKRTLYEGRDIARAEREQPGIVERSIEEMLERGEEPSRANLKRALDPYIVKRAELDAQEAQEALIRSQVRAAKSMWNKMHPEARRLFAEWVDW